MWARLDGAMEHSAEIQRFTKATGKDAIWAFGVYAKLCLLAARHARKGGIDMPFDDIELELGLPDGTVSLAVKCGILKWNGSGQAVAMHRADSTQAMLLARHAKKAGGAR